MFLSILFFLVKIKILIFIFFFITSFANAKLNGLYIGFGGNVQQGRTNSVYFYNLKNGNTIQINTQDSSDLYGVTKSSSNFLDGTIGYLFKIGNKYSSFSFLFGPEITAPFSNKHSFIIENSSAVGSDIYGGNDANQSYSVKGFMGTFNEKYSIVGKFGIAFEDKALIYGLAGASFATLSNAKLYDRYKANITDASVTDTGVDTITPINDKSSYGLKSGIGVMIKINESVNFGMEYVSILYQYKTNVLVYNYTNTASFNSIISGGRMYLNISL